MANCARGHSNTEGNKYCGTCGSDVVVVVESGSAPPSVRMRTGSGWRSIVTLAIALCAVLGTAVTSLAVHGPEKPTIKGMFVLFDSDVSGSPDDCEGTGGYDDVDAGTSVVVRDERGKIVGSGSLRNGSLAVLAERIAIHDDSTTSAAMDSVRLSTGIACTLLFDVAVDSARFYEIEVGRRGKQSYSRTELAEKDWVVSLTLGL